MRALSARHRRALADLARQRGVRTVARTFGTSARTIERALAGLAQQAGSVLLIVHGLELEVVGAQSA